MIGIMVVVFVCGFGLSIKLQNERMLEEINERTVVEVTVTQKTVTSERGEYIFNNHPILISDIRTAAELPEVKSCNFTFQPANGYFNMYEMNLDLDSLLKDADEYVLKGEKYLDTFAAVGVNDISLMYESLENPFEPESDKAEAVITKGIADIHGLKVGDEVNIPEYPPILVKEIIESDERGEILYVPIGFIERLGYIKQNVQDLSVSCFKVKFIMNSPDAAQSFIMKAQQRGAFDNKWFYLEANDSDYKVETSRMKMLSTIIEVLVIGAIIAGMVIIAGVCALHIRSKKYDIHTLHLLGIRPGRITILNFGELLTLAILGTFIGSIFAAVVCSILGYSFVITLELILLAVGMIALCSLISILLSLIMLRDEAGK